MPGLDRRIDPKTGDYIDDGRGAWAYTDTLETAMFHQIATKLGLWWFDGAVGCALWRLRNINTDAISISTVRNAVKTALQVFVSAGLARALVVTVERPIAKRILVRSTLTDAQTGATSAIEVAPFPLAA